jgi:hypothetical protein
MTTRSVGPEGARPKDGPSKGTASPLCLGQDSRAS